RIGKIDLPEVMPIVASEETEYYRNKLEFTFSNNRWLTKKEIESGEAMSRDALGFHIPRRFDKILQINHCYLQGSLSNEIRLSVDQYARENSLEYFDLNEQTGLLRNLLIRTSRTGDIMVIVQFAKNEEVIIQKLLEHIHKTFPTASSIMYVINTKKNDTFIDQEVLNYFGPGYINEIMIIPDSGRTLTFKIGPKSFFQTNSKQANILYNYVRELADIHEDEIVYDLYSGTGTIANFVADKAKKVVGLEYVADAIEDAKVNSQINGISNTSFHAGDMKKLLTDEFFKKHGSPQVIITDPPRAGMPEDVCRMILKARPKKIVYVSCNPSTQARDLMLFDSDYEVKKVIPVDMFPHTLHVENIILLILRE
ncbi:MAG: 23S rRNA (uracil(1939)-C(5))-methyltransferase RlmD, partial [Cyclobacteriaceae bacterium]|nr:23S rRNA (uracil(1939)-C(5))-methyltransferase RlmD [Cyclobacteriaceae bacterium]